MTVENSNGQKEVLTDYQSFAAGYRSAVMDLTGHSSRYTPFSSFIILVLFVVGIRLLWKYSHE